MSQQLRWVPADTLFFTQPVNLLKEGRGKKQYKNLKKRFGKFRRKFSEKSVPETFVPTVYQLPNGDLLIGTRNMEILIMKEQGDTLIPCHIIPVDRNLTPWQKSHFMFVRRVAWDTNMYKCTLWIDLNEKERKDCEELRALFFKNDD